MIDLFLDQIQRLSGHTADPRFLSEVTVNISDQYLSSPNFPLSLQWLTFNHSRLIKKIDTVRAFYFGTSYLVEVDIVLAEDMLLKEAHDIGESLQKKIEELPDVERVRSIYSYIHLHSPLSLEGLRSYRLRICT